MKKKKRRFLKIDIFTHLNYRYHLTLFPPTSQQLVQVSTMFKPFFNFCIMNIEEIKFNA